MKSIVGSSKVKFLLLMAIIFLMIYSCYSYHNFKTYQSIKVVVNKSAVVEYGTANYDINELIEEVEGEIVSVKKDIDTSKLGEQEIIVEVKKDNIVKDIPIIVSVVDTIAPVINLKEDKITITQGESYDLSNNILSIVDEIDGELNYLEEVLEGSNNCYHFDYNDNLNSVGNHEITIRAIDKSGNVALRTFTLEVQEPEPVVAAMKVYSDLPTNPSFNDLVSIAYSLVGSPYVSGANGPYAFDCSGFVQYVYSRVGIAVSRSASTQLYDGVAVSYENAQPGDILSWGYVDGVATHSALYVGNGQMVHATNPRQGVIASDVAAWTRGSGTRVISVRRIQ